MGRVGSDSYAKAKASPDTKEDILTPNVEAEEDKEFLYPRPDERREKDPRSGMPYPNDLYHPAVHEQTEYSGNGIQQTDDRGEDRVEAELNRSRRRNLRRRFDVFFQTV